MAGMTAARFVILGILIQFVGVPLGAQDGRPTRVVGNFVNFYLPDDFGDKDTSAIFARSEDNEGSLSWMCHSDGSLAVVLNFGHYYGGNENEDILIRYRFDEKQASGLEHWGLGRDHESASRRLNCVAGFTSQARVAGTVILEAVDPLDGESNRFRFSLTGFEEAIALLSCAVAK